MSRRLNSHRCRCRLGNEFWALRTCQRDLVDTNTHRRTKEPHTKESTTWHGMGHGLNVAWHGAERRDSRAMTIFVSTFFVLISQPYLRLLRRTGRSLFAFCNSNFSENNKIQQPANCIQRISRNEVINIKGEPN